MSNARYKCPKPTPEQILVGNPNTSQQLKFFVIRGTNRYPSQIHMAIFEDNKKIKGHNLIPNELTPKFRCFDSLTEAYNHKCPCGKQSCQYDAYLRLVVDNFRIQITRI